MLTPLVGFTYVRLGRARDRRGTTTEPEGRDVVATSRDLLNQAKSAIREVTGRRGRAAPGERSSARRPRARRVRAGRHPRRACTSPGATSSPASRAGSPTRRARVVVYCAGGVRSAFAAKTLAELGYTDVVSMVGGFNRWKDEGRDWQTPAHPQPRAAQPLPAPPAAARGGRGGPAQAARRQGAAARAPAASARRPRSTWPRPGWAPSASSTWTWSTPPTCSARSCTTWTGSASARSTRPRRRSPRSTPTSTSSPTTCASVPTTSSTSSTATTSIVDGTDNFPTRYLVNDASLLKRHPGRARLDLPLRGPGHRVRPLRRALLPLPWCPSRRRPSWRRRAPRPACWACCPASSARSRPLEAIKMLLGIGEPLVGPAAGLRRPGGDLPDLQGAARPGVPGLRPERRRRS